MKGFNFNIVIIITCFFFSLQSMGQVKQGFEVNGHIDGLPDGLVVKLFNRNGADWHIAYWMDSCVSKNGNFHLKTYERVPDGPRYYEIMFFKGLGPNGHSTGVDDFTTDPQEIGLFLDNDDKVMILANMPQTSGTFGRQIKNINVSGSKANAAMDWAKQLLSYADSHVGNITHRLRKITDSIGYNQKLVGEQTAIRENVDKFLDSVLNSATNDQQLAIPALIGLLHDNFAGYHGYFQKALFTKLPPALQNSYYGKLARNMVELSIGRPFPDFSLPTPEGNKVRLRDFVQKSKITLVHFWGSNSFDREKYQNELKLMYNKFHDKGLNIIAVSADTAKDDWEFIIHQKKFPWTNVIAEPRGWGEGSLINVVYGEGGHFIPNTTSVLIDDKGTILAWDVYGIVLRYYLEKYLGS